MEFKSQICTTREQSERLVAMGLKPETADMMWDAITVIRGKPVQEPMWSLRPYYYPKKSSVLYDNEEQVFIPAWSLHRLLELMGVREQMVLLPDAYDDTIADIEISIKTGHISKDYLINNESKD